MTIDVVAASAREMTEQRAEDDLASGCRHFISPRQQDGFDVVGYSGRLIKPNIVLAVRHCNMAPPHTCEMRLFCSPTP